MRRETKSDLIREKFLLLQRKYPDKNTHAIIDILSFHVGIRIKDLEKIILAIPKKSGKLK